ncbi:MAG TPA: sugar ABC transporter permease [Firmicutes bacterium]|nr:sugar ABC transporter permease [Bacillota bacterium]HBT15374.1 sugar ABC transporter permease [Bacillota bacterium]
MNSEIPTRQSSFLLFIRKHNYLLLVLPALLLYTVFIIYPFLNSIRYSFFEWSGVGPMTYIGLGNYHTIFFGALQEFFVRALKHNLFAFVINFSLQTIFGLGLALALYAVTKGSNLYKTIFFLPNTLSTVIVGFLWNLLLNPQWGMVNRFFEMVGLDFLSRPWLGDPKLALPTILAVSAWRGLGFPILVYLAALLAIPEEYVEAAKIDGAKGFQIIHHIYIPLILPTTFTLMTLSFIWTFNMFDLIFALQGASAGPNYATDVLGTLFYRITFGGMGSSATGMGLGAAIAVVIFSVLFPVSYLLNRISKKFEL